MHIIRVTMEKYRNMWILLNSNYPPTDSFTLLCFAILLNGSDHEGIGRDICLYKNTRVFIYLVLSFNLSNLTCCILFRKYNFADIPPVCFSSLTRSPKNRRTGSKKEKERREIHRLTRRLKLWDECVEYSSLSSEYVLLAAVYFQFSLIFHCTAHYVLLSIKRKHKCHYSRYNVKYEDYEDYLPRYWQA